MNSQARIELLDYLSPGFLHGMCNALFKIQGQAQLLGAGAAGDSAAAGPGIMAACHEAAEAVEIYRLILDPELPSEPVAAGPLLRDVVHLVRGRMQEGGVQVAWDETLESLNYAVRRRDLVLPVVTAMHRFSTALPTGFEGKLTVSAWWDTGLGVELNLAPSKGCLPFEVDLADAIRDASDSFAGSEARVLAKESGLGITIEIPTGAIA